MNSKIVLLTSSFCLVWAGETVAQSSVATSQAGTADTGASLEEVVVTAQRRSENLQKVPIAVTALSAEALAQNDITNVVDLRSDVAGLNIMDTNGQLSTSLRGVGSAAVNPGFENPIAIYVDGVYYASPVSNAIDLNNIAQVEVLKGPQGTLFGRNATGGLLQITTRDPGQDFHAEGSLGYENYQTVLASAYISGGIADNLAADLAVQSKTMGEGWGTNLYDGRQVMRVNHDESFRSKWIFTPSSATKLTLIADYSERSASYGMQVVPGTNSGFPGAVNPAPNRGYDIDTNVDPFKRGHDQGISLKWDQDFGAVDFSSITAYRNYNEQILFDYDASPAPLASVGYTWLGHQLTQEFQVTSKSTGRLKWVAGLYYFDATDGYAPIELNLDYTGADIHIFNQQNSRSVAGYGQGTYEITDDTRLTLGARYTYERRLAYGGLTDVIVVPVGPTIASTSPDEKATFDKFTYRASLDHDFTPDILGYISFNTGFKSGGFNTGSPGTSSYAPETIDAYEIGLKTNLFDRRLRLNSAAYYYDYSNIQSQQLNSASGVIEIVSAASAKIHGIDEDFEALLAPGLRITGGAAWEDAKYGSFPMSLLSTPGGGVPAVVGSAAGNELPLSSKYTANIGPDYTVPLPVGSLNANINVYYNSGYATESDNAIRQGGFTQLGSSVKWTSQDEHYWVSLYGKNITNKRVIAFETTIGSNGTHLVEYAEPAVYGIRVGVKF